MEQNKTSAEKENKKTALLVDDLASLESYVHDLFTFSPLPICFISPIGVFLEVNPSFEAFSNFKSYELIGESIEKLFSREDIKEVIEETLNKGFIEGKEIIFFSQKEEDIPVQVFTKVRKDEKGGVVGYFLGIFNLTETKKAEKELKRSQIALMNMLEDTEEAWRNAEEEKKRTHEIIINLTDGLLLFDKDNRLSLMNPQVEQFFKAEKKALTGKSISEFINLAEFKSLEPLFREGIKKLFRKEVKVTENFILEVSTIPLMAEEKNMGNLVVLHDVSREKLVERMKTEFVSVAAHQLRTPLSAIKWTLNMLLNGDLGKITSEQKEFMQKSYLSNERMIRLINDLLNVTRIEEGRYLYERVPLDIIRLVQSMVDFYKDEAQKRGINLEFKKPKKKSPEVMVDVEKIELAVQNILDNAVKYTPKGGKVIVALNYNKKEVVISIKDTGVGIPKNQQKRIFTKFFRGSNVIKLETDGSGLGLFITKNIIEAHGGKVWFESEENKGTTFYFSLPILLPEKRFKAFLK